MSCHRKPLNSTMSWLILLLLIVSIENRVVNSSGRKNYVEFYGNKCEIVNKCQSPSIYKYNNFNSGGVETGTFILVSIGDSCCHLFESISKSLSEHYIIYDELDNDSRISYQDHIKSFESTLHSEFQYDNNTDYKVVNKTNIISMIFTCLIIITFVIIKNHLNEQKYTYEAYRWMRKCKAVRFFTIRTLLMLIYCMTPNIVSSSVEIYCDSTTTDYVVNYNSYEVTNTNNATVNYDSIQLNVEDGNYLEFSTCNSDGDTYLQIYDINNNFIAVDDDSCNYLGCGCGAKITGTVDLQQEHSHSNNITWELRLGCWANTMCTSTLRMDGCRYYGTSLDDNIWESTSVPTYNPTSVPTPNPTSVHTHYPTSAPTHYPNNGDGAPSGIVVAAIIFGVICGVAIALIPLVEKREDDPSVRVRVSREEVLRARDEEIRARDEDEDRRARSREYEERRAISREEEEDIRARIRDEEEERIDKREEILRATKGLPEPFDAAQRKQKRKERKEERAKREQEMAKREREIKIREEERVKKREEEEIERVKKREEEEERRRDRQFRFERAQEDKRQEKREAERIAREEAERKAREEKERVWREEERVKREKIHQAKVSRAREDDEFRIRFCLGIEDKWSSDDDSDVSDEEGGKLYDEYLQINQDLLGLDPVLEKNTRRRLVIRQKNILKEFDDLYDNWKRKENRTKASQGWIPLVDFKRSLRKR